MKKLLFALALAIPLTALAGPITAFTNTFAGTAFVFSASRFTTPATVTVVPGSGDTDKIEYSTTPTALSSPGTANWVTSTTCGAATAICRETLASPIVAIRFTRTAGTSTDTAEVCWMAE